MPTMNEKCHWEILEGLLQDSDGCGPDRGGFLQAMVEFRDTGSIADYFFCDFARNDERPDGLDLSHAYDSFNDEWNFSWECGPDPAEIDWTGLDKAIREELGDN